MKSTSLMILAATALAGCSVNSSTPVTAWGKKNVSMLDYRTDAGQCAMLAVTLTPEASVANTAGGISGQNPTLPPPRVSTPTSGGSAGAGSPAPRGPATTSGDAYRDSASADFVNRAAMQQRTQEMAEQRARNEALKSCLTNRGYTEFELTPEQRAALSRLPQGSDQRREYLYKLGTDPAVLAGQSVSRKPPGS